MQIIEKDNSDSEISFTRKPDIFISYSKKNINSITQISQELNICGIDVWLDDWEIEIGDSLYDKLSKAIENSKFVALLLSQDYLNSKWATAELKQAFAREMRENRKVILPILIEKVQVPAFVEDKIYIDLTDNYYFGFTRLAGFLNGIKPKLISEGINKIKPKNIKAVVEILNYYESDFSMIVDERVFREIVKAGGNQYTQNKVKFYPSDIFNSNVEISARTAQYIINAMKIQK